MLAQLEHLRPEKPLTFSMPKRGHFKEYLIDFASFRPAPQQPWLFRASRFSYAEDL